MIRPVVAVGIIALVISGPMARAQQSPAQPREPHPTETMKGNNQAMMMMDSLNRRFDSLVDRMNRTMGNQKVTAMAAVINELVAQRKAMQTRMHQMMESEGGMMRMMNDSASPAARVPAPSPDSATADTGHTAHHPPK